MDNEQKDICHTDCCVKLTAAAEVPQVKASELKPLQVKGLLRRGHYTEERLTSKEPCVPVTDREKRSTEPAKVTLIPPHVPEANLTLPTRVSGGGNSLLTLAAVADASSTSPNPAWHRQQGIA